MCAPTQVLPQHNRTNGTTTAASVSSQRPCSFTTGELFSANFEYQNPSVNFAPHLQPRLHDLFRAVLALGLAVLLLKDVPVVPAGRSEQTQAGGRMAVSKRKPPQQNTGCVRYQVADIATCRPGDASGAGNPRLSGPSLPPCHT